MNISGISSSDPISLSRTSAGDTLGKDAFMRLLVTQMKNQDPMAPAKNEEMLAQLAQFQSLEEMGELNANVVGLAVLQQSNALLQQLTSASELIGRDVEYHDESSGAKTWGRVDAVKIENGVAMLSIGGKNVPLANVLQVGAAPASDPSSNPDTSADSAA